MGPVVQLLTGILIAACLFAATLWSLAQIYRQKGWLRIAHAVTAGSMLLVMAGLAQNWIVMPVVMSGLLVAGSLAATFLERGWNRLLPLILLAFALALFAGLPFHGVATSALPRAVPIA